MVPQVLLFGYYGKQNLGDEAILESILLELTSGGIPLDSVTVASLNPHETRQRHGTRSVFPRSPGALFLAISRCSHVVYGGGGYHFTFLPGCFSLAVALLAKCLRKKVCVAFIGAEPVRGLFNSFLARCFLQLCDWISVRDAGSYTELKRIGVRKCVRVYADPVFSSRWGRTLCHESPHPPRTGTVVMSLLTARGASKYRHISPLYPDLVRLVAGHIDAEVVLIATSRGEGDVQVMDDISRSVQLDRVRHHQWPFRLQDLYPLLAQSRLAIGMRLHVLILSALAGTPFACIARSPKTEWLAESLGQPVIARLDSEYSEILSSLGNVLKTGQSDECMAKAVQRLRCRADSGLEELRRFLTSELSPGSLGGPTNQGGGGTSGASQSPGGRLPGGSGAGKPDFRC